MALLRDARTSATILEGTPLEVALAAAELDEGSYLFDDVGLKFDVETVRRAHAENVAGLEAELAKVKSSTTKDKAERVARLQEAVDEAKAPAVAAPELAGQAADAMAEARAAVDEA